MSRLGHEVSLHCRRVDIFPFAVPRPSFKYYFNSSDKAGSNFGQRLKSGVLEQEGLEVLLWMSTCRHLPGGAVCGAELFVARNLMFYFNCRRVDILRQDGSLSGMRFED